MAAGKKKVDKDEAGKPDTGSGADGSDSAKAGSAKTASPQKTVKAKPAKAASAKAVSAKADDKAKLGTAAKARAAKAKAKPDAATEYKASAKATSPSKSTSKPKGSGTDSSAGTGKKKGSAKAKVKGSARKGADDALPYKADKDAGTAQPAGDTEDACKDAAENAGTEPLLSGIPTDMESVFFGNPDYEWPERPEPGKSAGLRNLMARLRRDVDAWHLERSEGSLSKAPVGTSGSTAEAPAPVEGTELYDIEEPPDIAGSIDAAKTDGGTIRKKRRPWLLAVAAVAVVVVVALASFGIYTLVKDGGLLDGGQPGGLDNAGQPTSQLPSQRQNDAVVPNLAALPGLSLDDAKLFLGDGWQADEDGAFGGGSAGAVGAKAVRLVYAPSFSSTLDGAAITCILNDSAQVTAVTFTCPVEVLGYPERDFYELIADEQALSSLLASAGLSPGAASLVPPEQSDTEVFRLPGDEKSGVYQRSWTFTGRGSGAREDIWMLTVTYDYGPGEYADGAGAGGDGSSTAVTGGSDDAPLRSIEIGVY